MKIIQVTDVHLGRRREMRYGANLNERLDRCIDHINRRHSDATLCIFTGDLTDDGEAESYADLKAALSRLTVPYRLLPGNHDRRANLVAAFPENGTDGNGFVLTGDDAGNGERPPLETSRAGMFAVGDARAGSTKRVAAAVGEGAAAVAQIHALLAQA